AGSAGFQSPPQQYTYTAASSCGATLLPYATMSFPANNSTLSGNTVTFTWNAAANGAEDWLDVGTVQGQGNIFPNGLGSVGTATSYQVTGIPCNGALIYIQLWTRSAGSASFQSPPQ